MSACPKGCITYQEDQRGNIYPIIGEEKCIGCNICKRVCPNHSDVEKRKPVTCYAAWSNDPEERRTSASGGIAAEFYKYMIACMEGAAAGVYLDDNFNAKYKIADRIEELGQFKNSKYVFSHMDDSFQKILEVLKKKKKVIFIGLPCHNAALNSFLGIYDIDKSNLLTVDLICHGVASGKYLQNHIKSIEGRTKQKACELLFRDPEFFTGNFVFSLCGNTGDKFYKKGVYQDDVYSLAYHKALSYRENCYQCRYACAERCSDITIGDFSGLGKINIWAFDNINVSCVLVNTKKGKRYVEALLKDGRITARERPLEEALEFEKQLKKPSCKHWRRDIFEKKYVKTRDFEKAARIALRFEIIWNKLNYFLPLRAIRDLVAKPEKTYRAGM